MTSSERRRERLRTDPVFAEAYWAKARARANRRYWSPETRPRVLAQRRALAAERKKPREPIPNEKACTACRVVKPYTNEFFASRKEGRAKLKSQCKVCDAASTRKYYKTHREQCVRAVWRSTKKRLACDPAFREKQKEYHRRTCRKRRADPVKREIELARDREWRRRNWDRVKRYKHKCGPLNVASTSRRNARKLQATPPWSEIGEITHLYERAKLLTDSTGIKHEVDHIVPLRGREVCGLHVLANLRVITKRENVRKANKLIPTLALAS